MKKIYLLMSLVALLFTSCFDDDGNYTYKNVDEITIEGLDESYVKNSYAGEVLEIDPVIKTAYTDLEYEWWMWDPSKETGYTGWEENVTPYEAELISTDKKLSYKVECPIGQYTLMLKVTSKTNGYFNVATTRFDAQTVFTRGFYILKETSDGNTELDLYNRDNQLMSNLLEGTGLGAMKGKPLALGALQGHAMRNEAGEYLKIHTICVTTQDKEIAFFNTENLEKVHDASDVVTGGLKEGETPYVAFSYGYSNYFLSSRGCNVAYISSMMNTSGSIGIPGKTGGASTFVMCDDNMYAIYWNETEQKIMDCDHMGFGQFGDYDENGFSTQGMKCLMCGATHSDQKGYFILEDEAGKKYLYIVEFGSMNAKTIDRKEIDPSSKLASATAFATNVKTTNVLYFVTDNKLYSYNLANFTERETPLTLQGIGADETITYLSYQWQEYYNDLDYNFKHLVVGTQKGETYRLYMYDITAGEPRELRTTIEGTGKLKMCLYMSPAQYSGVLAVSPDAKYTTNSLPN